MTDLDTLRRALWETTHPAAAADDLDIAGIMKRGRRLRLRRRLAVAGGSLCVAAAVFGAVAGASHLTRPSPVPARPAVPARSPSPSSTGMHASPGGGPSPAPIPVGPGGLPGRAASTAPVGRPTPAATKSSPRSSAARASAVPSAAVSPPTPDPTRLPPSPVG
jgi:hypothetical protein